MTLREELINISLRWQDKFGICPAITCAVSEFDAATLIGMPEQVYAEFMKDRTAVSKGYDFIFNGTRYQIKAHRPSGKKGSNITNAGKAKNYDWDKLIWIRYDRAFNLVEAWSWNREDYIRSFDDQKRVSPADMRLGIKLK
jgi:hypothetical protein